MFCNTFEEKSYPNVWKTGQIEDNLQNWRVCECLYRCVWCMHVYIRVCVWCVCLYMCVVCACLCVCSICISVHVCVHVCTCVCGVCMSVHVCACGICMSVHRCVQKNIRCSALPSPPYSLETSISLNQELSYLSLVWLTTPDAGVSAASTPDAGVSGAPLATPGSLCGYRESEIPQAYVFAQQPFFPTH